MGSGWYHLMPVADYRRSHLTFNLQQKGRPMTSNNPVVLRKLLTNATRMETLAVNARNRAKVRAARTLQRHLRKSLLVAVRAVA